MDTALRLFVPLAAVSLFKREVDAASYQHRRLATGTTLSSYDVWSTQSTCQVCRDCMNTSYSYLCGRLQCQCLDSLEYCTLMIEEIQSDGITFVQLNATDRAFLGPTTLAGDLQASDAQFSGTLSAERLHIDGLQSRLVNVSGSVQTPDLQTTTLNVTCDAAFWDMSMKGPLQGVDIGLSGALHVPNLESNNIVAINITSKALTALADFIILGSLQAENACFSEVQGYSLQSTRLVSTGDAKLAETNVTGPLTGQDATFSGMVTATFMGSSQVSTVVLRSVTDATLGNTNNYGNFTVVGNFYVDGDMTIEEGDTDIQGSVVVNGDLTTYGEKVTLSGNLLQQGDTLDISIDNEFTVKAETVLLEATEESNGNVFTVETALLNMEAPGADEHPLAFNRWLPTLSIIGWYVRFLGYSPPTPPPFVWPTVNPFFANPPSVKVSGPVVALYAYIAAFMTALVNFRISAEIRTYVNSQFGIRFFSVVGLSFLNPLSPPNLSIYPNPADPTSSLITSICTTVFQKNLDILVGPFDVTADENVIFQGDPTKDLGTSVEGDVTIEGDTTMEGVDDFNGDFELTGASEFAVEVSIEGDLDAGGATQVNAEANFNGAFYGTAATTVNVDTPLLACEGVIDAASIEVTGETVVAGGVEAGAIELEADLDAAEASIPFLEAGDMTGGTADFITIESAVWIGPIAIRRNRRRHLQSSLSINGTQTTTSDESRAFLTAIRADRENEAGHFSGTLWYSGHPVEIDPGVDEAGNRVLAFEAEGDVRVNGAIFSTPSDTDGSTYVAVGDIPSPSLREEIRPGSILLSGDQGGAIYASTNAHVSPVYSLTVSCSITAGSTQGSSLLNLPYLYQVGIVMDRVAFQDEQGRSISAPSALYVRSNLQDHQPTKNFTFHCESLLSPEKGKTYTYTSHLLFFHSVLAHSSAY